MRTDRELQNDVAAELNWEPSVDTGRIAVDVLDGVATLSGLVSSYVQKCEAEAAALRVRGVKGVIVKIDVELPDASQRSDREIAAAARHALAWNAAVPRNSVTVAIKNGWAMLSGAVEWEYQSRAAELSVRSLVGIQGLVNLIEIKPRIQPREVTHQIEAALRRRSHHRPEGLSVVVNGGTVTLSGELGSWSERHAARLAAWNAPGIRNVVDHTTVAA
ncbi:MAG TPA: BON domain-containing protein [Rhodanobacteraceae bacterium]|jgi:osmotically-inducible protein OsmY|nr:BON domain-containing protein [Rhodanobacteraceae bacterium]